MFSAATKTDNVSSAANYIEDVFSTYLYTGNGVVQTIPNGIALGSAYGGSVYFDGTGDNLSVADNTAFTLPANFTIECWIYPTAGAANRLIISKWGGTAEYYIFTQTNNVIGFAWGPYSASGLFGGALLLSGNNAFALNTWSHVAVVRNSNTFTLYVNGTSIATATNSAAVTDGAEPLTIGDYGGGGFGFAGYISNARIVKGTAVYTANFTPSATPLTAISGTSLLTCQTPNTVLDYSSNAFTITVTNAVAQNGGGPFTDSTANKGGLVWLKLRNGASSNILNDTVNGAGNFLYSNTTNALISQTWGVSSFLNNGFQVSGNDPFNNSTGGYNYTSWTFREQAKFFDVVTFTASAAAAYTFNHNLGSTPGFVIIKPTSVGGAWYCYHTSLGVNKYLLLNTTDASGTNPSGNWAATSTTFTVPTDFLSGGTQTYVAYLFAHNAGGFGPAGTDNVISCGSFNGASAGSVSLGYEPQWILFKDATSTTSWVIYDVMRGWSVTSGNYLLPNSSGAEANTTSFYPVPNATGFSYPSGMTSGNTIYIAIRRGPMKTPTSGTTVYSPVARTGTGAAASISSVPFPPDWVMFGPRSIADNKYEIDRLRGNSEGLITNSSSQGIGLGASLTLNINGISFADGNSAWNQSSATYVNWFFGRAPGFFDVVCYTGTGANRTVTHNLGVVPELMIVKCRDLAGDWTVWQSSFSILNRLRLNTTQAVDVNNTQHFGGTLPTSSVFYVGSTNSDSGALYVAYLFASCPGVSKVGSYTGTGALQTINCGFAAGARYVLIKRTDSTGAWYVYDSARGISSGNDPYLLLNSNVAEVANTNYVDTASTGFQVTAAAPADLNANGGTYIFLAIA